MPGEEDDAVALVRVYCGLASADETVRSATAAQLTIAVVDDAGRLLGVHEISDDPAGYAQLGTLLVERTSGFTEAAIAADSDDHMVTSLLTAAGRPLVVADDDTTDDFAERFADDDSIEEMQAPPAARRAVGLARALQAGAIEAVTLPAPRELTSYKPILAAHVAMLNGRYSAAIALREVLRELYPAALRAYPDPAHPLATAVLDALPEPGRLSGRGNDTEQIAEEVVAELTRAGAGTEDQVTAAVTALVVAISESPRRGGVNKSLAPAAADTVRQAIGAVRSCDNACEALVGTLAARVSPQSSSVGSGRRAAGSRRAAEPVPAASAPLRPPERHRHPDRPAQPPRAGRRQRAGHAAPADQPAGRTRADHAAAAGAAPDGAAAGRARRRRRACPAATPGQTPGNRPVSVPPPPPGMTPIVPGSRPTTMAPVEAGQQFRPTITDAAMSKARAERQRTVIPPRPNTRTQQPPRPTAPPTTRCRCPAARSRTRRPARAPTGRCSTAATTRPPRRHRPRRQRAAAVSSPPADGRVRPPWQDMPTEPPALRLVEPQLNGLANLAADVTAITEPPPLRLVDRDLPARNGRTAARAHHADRPGPQHPAPGPRRGRRRPADLRRGPIRLVHRPRRALGRDGLGQPVRHRLARRGKGGDARRWPPRRRPACPSGSPRPTWCPVPRCARSARCASSATRPASRRTPRGTSAVGAGARRSAATPSAAARAARRPAAGTSAATARRRTTIATAPVIELAG